MKQIDKQLVGYWAIDLTDTESIKQMGKVSLTFQEDNILKYIVEDKGTIQISSLTYWIQDGSIMTVQPPSKDIEITKYLLESNDSLILMKDRSKTRFKRML